MSAKLLILALMSVTVACYSAKQIKTTLEHEPKAPIDKYHDSFPGHFSDEWKQIFNNEHLRRQPKWKLAKKQPVDASYEVREYEPAWYVTFSRPCISQVQSAAKGYIHLLSYMWVPDHLHSYALTYPILSEIELNAEQKAVNRSEEEEREIAKDRELSVCSDRFSQHFYLPVPLTQTPREPRDLTLSTQIVPAKTYYVHRYDDKLTVQSQTNCNVQAGYFATKLALSGVRFNPRSYYCAVYQPGNLDDVTALFEILFDQVE